MSNAIEVLDARRRRGTYRIRTASGTLYLVEVHKSAGGGMRVISNGSAVTSLRTGTVRGCKCPDNTLDEPIIRIDERMHLAERGVHIVMTSEVREIMQIEDGAIDVVICQRCQRGYRPKGFPCSLCRAYD